MYIKTKYKESLMKESSLASTNLESAIIGTKLTVIRLISIGVSLIVTAINKLLAFILEYFTKLELRSSKTSFENAYMWKTVLVPNL